MAEATIIAKGEEWGESSLMSEMFRHGIDQEQAKDVLYLIENTFSKEAIRIGCKAEWSIRYAEVTGFPEDFQFDIDALRMNAIEETFDSLEDEAFE